MKILVSKSRDELFWHIYEVIREQNDSFVYIKLGETSMFKSKLYFPRNEHITYSSVDQLLTSTRVRLFEECPTIEQLLVYENDNSEAKR